MAVDRKELAGKVRQRLARAIPSPQVELDYQNAWQLLMATILAAQNTDKNINTITPKLFAKWPTPEELGAARPAAVEKVIHASGFFRQKAKSIQAASRMIAAEFGGEVPKKLEQAVRLPGVARKTANVVLGSAYRISSGIVVDTHCGRVSRRLGLTAAEDPVAVEKELCDVFARRTWIDMSHRFILHGRYVCIARAPKCGRCPLNELCGSAESEAAGRWGERAAWEQRLVESRGAVRD